MHFVVAVLPVAGFGARHLGQEPERFVVPNHLGRYAGACRCFADVQPFRRRPCYVHRSLPFHRRSVSALVTTLTLLKAIAAPAITGLSRPKAASGMPTTS